MKFVCRVIVAAVALVCVAPVPGQDFSPMADFATARGMSASQSAAMTDVFRHTLGRGAGRIDHRALGGSRAKGGSDSPPAPSVLARLKYRSTPATMQAALAAYIERGKSSNPKAAEAAERAMTHQDIGGIYRRIVAPFGLKDGNVADALTAYTVLGWMIANGRPDPSPSTVQAVRDQMTKRLVAVPQLSRYDPVALGEELKVSFVILHSGWQSARRDGGMGQFADGVAAMFARQGLNVRALRLTSSGFEPQPSVRSKR